MTDELKLGWTIREYYGQDVCWLDGTVITDKDSLKEGYEFLAGGWKFIAKGQNGELCGYNDHTMCVLRFGEDDRNCWVAVGFVNRRGIKVE
jgi:hypothetical protein